MKRTSGQKKIPDLGVKWKPDIVVQASTSASLNPRHVGCTSSATETTLVLEFKAPGIELGRGARVQIGKYALEMLNLGLLDSQGNADCLAIGSHFESREWAAPSTVPATTISVSPVNFDRISMRAKKLSLDVYDDLKDVAPFLLTGP